MVKKTALHYTKQWGPELNFQNFVEENPIAALAMPNRKLGWYDFFAEIRMRAKITSIKVYDACCGHGDVARRLFEEPAPEHISYIGADIHDSLSTISASSRAEFIKWDVSEPMANCQEKFDYIICRAALHHTADPKKTYQSLVSQLKPGGKIAISVYARKAPMREALDDLFREKIVPLENEEAFFIASQFSKLGSDLQKSSGSIKINCDLPFLGIKAGEYFIQEFIYDYFLKCWHNPLFSEKHCDLVNFDWYHPEYAYRYTLEEAKQFALDSNLEIVVIKSIKAQHYLEAKKPTHHPSV